ncbi:MAG: TorF family putative porin [Fimbriimonadaceae bacterium]
MNFKNLAIILMAVTPIVAQADETPITVTADVPFFNKYVWRGVNLLNDPVLQPSINLAFQGWNLNFWGDYDINNAKQFDEFDVTVSYTGDLPQGSWTAGYIDYAFPGSSVSHTREIYGNFTFAQDYSPYVQLNFDSDEVDGLYARFGAQRAISTAAGDINVHGWFGYGDKNMNNALYGNNKVGLADFGLEATYSKQLSQNATGYVKLGYTALLDKNHLSGAPNRNNVTFGFGIGLGF